MPQKILRLRGMRWRLTKPRGSAIICIDTDAGATVRRGGGSMGYKLIAMDLDGTLNNDE